MADGFDIVAVRVPDEGGEVALVVLRPQPRRVQRLGAQLDRGEVKCPHRVVVGGRKGEVRFPVGPHACTFGDPEHRLTVPPVADGLAENELPRITQYAQHPVVELLRTGVVGAVDSEMINHRNILASGTDTVVDYLDDL